MTSRRESPSALTDQEIYDRVYQAILERRLRPGMHLREIELASMFGVGRTKVRQALVKLVEVGIVDVARNRGATVAAPTRKLAGQVFELRSMLEPEIAACLARDHTRAQIARLRSHLVKEDKAREAGDEALLIRHTGDFHLLLAAQLANPMIDRLLKGLEALTCLSILSFSRGDTSACLPREHTGIVEAMDTGNAVLASQLMALHLDHVRAELDLEDRPAPSRDLIAAFGLAGPPRSTRRAGKRG
jgi:DNA-binding GntR family transcriptional regulator